ncbi:phospholipase A1-like isoform X1 [Megachile rotundata]|uniref:phospholipase A1-like isoform X1 n=2 Tax=Megachile rotundata TaxID=143995 RepID=UPI003FD4E4F9
MKRFRNVSSLQVAREMGTNKIYVKILLLLTVVTGTFAWGLTDLRFGLNFFVYTIDDYGNTLKQQLTVFNNEQNTSESNYRNIISFNLYTRNRRKDYVRLYINDVESLKRGQFDPRKPTVFVVTGWETSCFEQQCTYIRDAYLQHGDYNLILIEWHEISTYEYIWVSLQLVKVAKYVAHMIDFLASQGMDPSNTTVIGHSLGAHIAGLSSYYAKNKVNYVIGLDPAGPGFHFRGPDSRLSKEDANYVLVIHTSDIYGMDQSIGHADFYVNGGVHQNGCNVPLLCDHIRSYEYFAESVNSNGFVARKCDSFANYELGLCNLAEKAHMGGVTPDFNVEGSYYLTTNSKPPFAKN